MKDNTLVRVFKHNDIELTDPNPQMLPAEVIQFYSNQYPEITNGSCSGYEIDEENCKIVYTIKTNFGDKG
jgi:PRTRC genetic system protein C